MSVSTVGGARLSELALPPAEGSKAAGNAAAISSDFGDILGRLLQQATGTLREGEVAAAAGIQGSLPMQTVVDRVMAAERTLQAALAVRDKAVSAYQEISRMQI